nr:hypothetical protein [Tanacetum cinerariifolium]
MATTIEQQVALDEALVPSTQRLRIRRSNFRFPSDIHSKESTLKLVYDVLRRCPFVKAFLVTADVPEVYMQEFWATAYVHQRSIRFKLNNKKHTVYLESFREMLHICPRIPGEAFVELPFKEEILEFIRFLGHGYDSLRLCKAQILWGLYHKRNVDFAYLMWEDFVYQVEHKDTKKSNEMYYPRFTKVIIHHFMSKDPSIPRRNKVNWHYVRDDHMFSMIKLVSRHQNMQHFSALLHIELTNEDIRNSNAYKEYYEVATGATPPKPKASVWKTRSSFDTTITPLTAAAGPRLTTSEKGKQAAKASKAKSLSVLYEVAMTDAQQMKLATKRSLQQTHISQMSGSGADEGTDSIPGVPDVPTDESEEEISWNSIDEEGDDDEGKDGNGEENLGINVGREERHDEEEDEDELYRDSSSVSSQFMTSMLNPTPDAGIESIFEMTSQMDVQVPTSVAPLPMSAPTLTSSTIATITTTQQAPLPPTTAPSTFLQDLPNFGSLFGFDNRLKTLEANFSEFMQTNQFAGAVSSIPGNAQADNDEFLMTIDENMQKIIKEQVKEQVKTSYVVAADLSEMELKKILIDLMSRGTFTRPLLKHMNPIRPS